MSKKLAFEIMLTLTVIGVLTFTFSVKPIEAEVNGVFPFKHKGFIDPLMDWYTVVGVLMNMEGDYVTDIKVRCVFRDAENNLVAFEEKTLYRGLLLFDKLCLPPGWTAPFEVRVTDTESSKRIASYEVSVIYNKVADPLKTHSLAIEELSLFLADRNELFGYEKWKVVGIIRNLAAYDATDTQVLAIFLDDKDFPVGVGGWSLADTQPGTIQAGDVGYFSLETIVPLYSTITNVQLIIEADEAFGHYPALPFKSRLSVVWETETFSVQISSNSSVGNLNLNQPEKELSFIVAGENGTRGFCNITIPKKLLWSEPTDWVITVDGEAVNYQVTETETHTFLYFTYEHSIKTVKIKGTHVISEFPTWLSMLLIFIILTITVAISKRRTLRPITTHNNAVSL